MTSPRQKRLRGIPPSPLILAAVVLVAAASYIYTNSNGRVIEVPAGLHPAEFQSAWKDEYRPLDGTPPWPRGATARQLQMIRNADRLWIAVLDPEPLPADERTRPSFHHHRVVAFREVTNSRHRLMFKNALLEASNYSGETGDWVPEGYPGRAARFQSGNEFLDCVIELKHRLIFLMDSSNMTFVLLPEDSSSCDALRRLFQGLPVDPMAD